MGKARSPSGDRRVSIVGAVASVRYGTGWTATAQGTALSRDLAGDAHRLAVHRLQVALTADVPQLLPVRVVGERDHHVRARAQELPVQLAHRVGEVENHLGHERARLDVTASFQLEDVALSAEHGPGPQPIRLGVRVTSGAL